MTILEQIQTLDENGLRTKIVIPLMKLLGCLVVRDLQGPDEMGKDILYKHSNIYGQKIYGAIVLKATKIDQANVLTKVKQQISQAMNEIPDPENVQSNITVSEISIMTSFNLTPNAQRDINLDHKRTYPNLYFVDGNELEQIIKSKIDKETMSERYTFSVDTFRDFCEKSSGYAVEEQAIQIKATEATEGEAI